MVKFNPPLKNQALEYIGLMSTSICMGANHVMDWCPSKGSQRLHGLFSQLSKPNFSFHNTNKLRYLVMRKWGLMEQRKLLIRIKSEIRSKLFNEKYGLKLGEFNNTTWTERVKLSSDFWWELTVLILESRPQ